MVLGSRSKRSRSVDVCPFDGLPCCFVVRTIDGDIVFTLVSCLECDRSEFEVIFSHD